MGEAMVPMKSYLPWLGVGGGGVWGGANFQEVGLVIKGRVDTHLHSMSGFSDDLIFSRFSTSSSTTISSVSVVDI